MEEDWTAIFLTLRLALVSTLILLFLGIFLAYWLAFGKSKFKIIIESVVSLPLVLPPTVIGFYLLFSMGPNGPIGKLTQSLGLGHLAFTFPGLVIGSIIYSLPFVVRPIQDAMEAMGERPIEVAATLGANAFDRFFSVVLPLSLPGIFSALILGFAHTIGEFGVVLMIGGNIPGVTRVISVHIYDQVEAIEYGRAHSLSLVMVVFSFACLIAMNLFSGSAKKFRNQNG